MVEYAGKGKTVQVTLPDREEMLKRLKSLDIDPRVGDGLFPIIVERAAGAQFSGEGTVPLMLLAAMIDFSEESEMPQDEMRALTGKIPSLIDVLIDDEEKADRAKKSYKWMIVT